ncbi:hypothetical protein GCM10028895_29650 [Pontibacter rugosus]
MTVATQPDIKQAERPPVSQAIAKIALIGNPNSGKTSLFNQLTGLNQKVGNFPGLQLIRKPVSASLPLSLRRR